MQENDQVIRLQLLKQLTGAITGPIVNHNDLLGLNGRGAHPINQVKDRCCFIETGNNNREQGPRSTRSHGSFNNDARH
jgi:hypothetical protein